MALKKCKECGNDVSTKAESCPKCGAVLRKKTSGCTGCLAIVILGTIVVVVISSLTGTGSRPSGGSPTIESQPKTQAELRKEQIERQFSAWDGSHRGLTKVIKTSMNDPDSYDHVETVYSDMGEYLVVRTTFRGKNAFGGVVKNWAKAKVDLNGNVIEIIEQGP